MRRYVPELARFPEKFIYEPWRAPIADQKAAGCLVKGDGRGEGGSFDGGLGEGEGGMKIYPKPMFDFNERRGICIEGVKNAYHVNLYGDDERVKNGSWRALFPDGAEGPTEGKGGMTRGPTKEEASGEVDGGLTEGDMGRLGEKEKIEEGALDDEGAKTTQGGGKGRDLGVDQDETEARELGGETKGGDRMDRSPGKRKRGERQGTLDGAFGRRRKRGKT